MIPSKIFKRMAQSEIDKNLMLSCNGMLIGYIGGVPKFALGVKAFDMLKEFVFEMVKKYNQGEFILNEEDLSWEEITQPFIAGVRQKPTRGSNFTPKKKKRR